MQLSIGLLKGFMVGLEYAEDDEYFYVVLDIGIVRFVVTLMRGQ